MRWVPPFAFLLLAVGLALAPRYLVSRPAITPDFVHFESGHVHPVAFTPDSTRLLVVNTPDNRLSVFSLTGATPLRIGEVSVGMEPISVAARDDSTAWVVNHLSDNVSVVDLVRMHVKATIPVGDEPSDVVFSGNDAYVSVSQEDVVKVYNSTTFAAVGSPIAINGRMPRALARSSDGTKVYAAVFHGGNRTSVLSFTEAMDSLPAPNPPMAQGLPPAPDVGLIVQQQGGDWRDESGKLWNSKIKYSMHEVDVAEINTSTRTVTRNLGNLGSVNFALGASPVANGLVALTSTEARNLTRFEPNLTGHAVDTRISFITIPTGDTAVMNINPHVFYAVTTGPAWERDSSIGIPTGVAFSGDGQRVYVTSLASNKLAVIDPAATPTLVRGRVPTVAGPTGVAVDRARGRLYVVGRFRNELQTLSTETLNSLDVKPIGFDPTPDAIVNGRRFFYGGFTSGHGEQACATCHVFGDFDNLAWDLGDPQGNFLPPPPGQLDPALEGFHPMKGPMVTQSLRGLPGTGVLHWRGDRANLSAFNPAFVSLLGRATVLADSEMTALSDFVVPLAYPPNPRQHLNRTMADAPATQGSALRGQNFFNTLVVDGGLTCNQCHTSTGFGSGTNGQIVNDSTIAQDQDVKAPQLRNLYKKTGFGDKVGAVNKRGFGFTHDGSVDSLFTFLLLPRFSYGTGATGKRRDLQAFLLSFDTGMAPAVGYQVTFTGGSNPVGVARVDTLRGQADTDQCDVIAKGRVAGEPRGWMYLGEDLWKPDKPAENNLGTAALIALATGPSSALTVMGVPKGSGQRMGIDRDRDTYLDGEERDAGSNPGDPRSTPLNVGVMPAGMGRIGLERLSPNPFRGGTEVWFGQSRAGKVELVVYDLMGREVRSLVRGWRAAGRQSVRWDGRRNDGGSAGSGVYFVRLRSEEGQWTRPVVRIQ